MYPFRRTNTQFNEACSSVNCEVSFNGKVTCIPPCSHSTTCDREYRNWPKDKHECVLAFGAWIHRADALHFKDRLATIDESDNEHKEWKIIESKVEHKNFNSSDNELYASVYYVFTIRRISASDMLLVVGPMIGEYSD